MVDVISIIVQASFFLDLLHGHTITKDAYWIPTKIDYREVYRRMPRRIDCFRLIWKLKHKVKKSKGIRTDE